jgi:hypothetical protein
VRHWKKEKALKNNNHSLGGLRPNPGHDRNPRAPELLGRILIQKTDLEALYRTCCDTDLPLVEATLAGWVNRKPKKNGKTDSFLTVELRPLSADQIPWWTPQESPHTTLEDFFT